MRHTGLMGLASLLLAACGGGGGDGNGGNPPPAPPPQSTQATLSASNYQNAAKLAMGLSVSGFTYAKLGVSITDQMINLPIFLPPAFPCPEGGTQSVELTDQNGDTSLDPGDTLHLRWNECRVQGTTTSGLVRVEVNTATETPSAREYLLFVTVADFNLQPADPNLRPAPINFSAQVQYTRTPTSDHTTIVNGSFSTSPVVGDEGPATVNVDYRQDYATQTYTWSTRGTMESRVIGGEFEFQQATAFTGVLGEYPSGGRLSFTGFAGSTSRLSEEGTAAADVATVLVSVDSNGDGIADADAALAWSAIVPVQVFATFPTPPGPGLPSPP